jgi:hypothetical protein
MKTSRVINGLSPEFPLCSGVRFLCEALSHLRKLQSDDAVYLAAIDRLKTIGGIERGSPREFEGGIQSMRRSIPGLPGEGLRDDLQQYTALQAEARPQVGPCQGKLRRRRFRSSFAS